MNVSEFVTKVANPYFSPHIGNLSDISDDFLKSSIKFAVKNKVFSLFYDGCSKLRIHLPREAELLKDVYEKRKRVQMEAISLLLSISEELDIEIMFFKTFKPFRYIPDDIDILLRNEKDFKPLINRLRKEGYFILKVGTPEVVLRKIEEDSYVDIDIHKRLAVGHLDLFRVENLWQKHANETFKLDNGRVALKLSEDYEIVREAAYSLLKDFHLSIPGLYLGINAIMNQRLANIEKIAAKWNLLSHLYLYLYSVHYITHKLFKHDESKTQLLFQKKDLPTIPFKLVDKQLRKRLKLPYRYPILVIIWAYTVKVRAETSQNRNIAALSQLMKQPSSKGVGILLEYVRGYFH